MNADVKAKWVAALRSGEYKQGRHHLRDAGRFCCLGVLCELAVEAGVVEREGDCYGAERERAGLPEEVQEWSGIHGQFGRLPREVDGNTYLDSLNDGGHSFEQIADVIEEQL